MNDEPALESAALATSAVIPEAVMRRPGTSRIVGLDIARGLAVLGMFGAHLLTRRPIGWDSGSWSSIMFGRSSILFAVLAGISIALLSGRQHPVDGIPLLQARVRILVRAVIIFAIGGLVAMLETGIAVILEYYALLFVLALPFLRWRPRKLFLAAAALAIVGPVAHILLLHLSQMPDRLRWDTSIVRLSAVGTYPALIFLVFVLVGLGIGRLDLGSGRVRRAMLIIGIALAVVGYSGGHLAQQQWGAESAPSTPAVARAEDCVIGADGITRCARQPAQKPPDIDLFDFSGLWTFDQHSGSPFEITGSMGVALAVIALCLLLSQLLRIPLYPLAAIGSMALSAYVAQLIAFHILHRNDLRVHEVRSYLLFVLATAIVATIWKLLLGRGPLERLLTSVSTRAADITV